MDKSVSLLFFFFILVNFIIVGAAELASTPQEDGHSVSETIDPNSNSDLMGPSLIRRNRASHPRQQQDLNTFALLGQQDEGTTPTAGGTNNGLVRQERNLLKGLPLPTAALITELLITLNNILAKFDVTVVLLPSPFPNRLAQCIPGCLQNAECRGAITTNAYGAQGAEGGGSPLTAVLGLLKLGGL